MNLYINNLKTKNYEQKTFNLKSDWELIAFSPIYSIIWSIFAFLFLLAMLNMLKCLISFAHTYRRTTLYIYFKELSQYKYNKNIWYFQMISIFFYFCID